MGDPLEEIRAQLAGKGFGPLEERYDELRTPFNVVIDQHPALIVAAESAEDVAAAVRLAKLRGLAVGVQATGHGVVMANDGGLLINTSRLRGVTVDPDARTVTVGAGVPWSEVIEQTAPYGLLPLLGSSAQVGAVGYSLGGGTGWMVRAFGLAADSIVSAELVTADGDLRRIDSTAEPELLWGLKGGAGNFGVVTSLTLRVFPVDAFYGGAMLFPIDRAREVMVAYRDWTRTLPTIATTAVALARFPDVPSLPESLRGQSVVGVRAGFLADAEAAEQLLAPLRSLLGEPLVDTFRPLPLDNPDTLGIGAEAPVPMRTHVEVPRELSDELIDALLRVAGPGAEAPYAQVELRHHGGGALPAADRQGLGHWSGEFMLLVYSVAPTPAITAAVERFHAEVAAAVKPHVSGLIMLNGLMGAPGRTSAAFTAEHYRRLVELKKRYDPDNLFRVNNNIPPTG